MRITILLLMSLWLLASEHDTLDLLEDLQDASEIATRTKLNIDKTPAVVSVLHADQLKKLGIVNLFEALETVPGIETSMGTAGAKQINMRGNKSTVSDKLKLMINGISVNTEVTGASFFYLDMPIEIIKRIEVIRGPSSALYGSFAHIGVINVITKENSDEAGLLFGNASSEGYGSAGFVQSVQTERVSVRLDGFYLENDNSRSYGPYDGIPTQTEFTSYEDFTNVSLGANLRFSDDLSLQARWLELDLSNHFGYNEWPINEDPKSLTSTSIISELRYTPKLTAESSLDIKAGYKRYGIEGGSRLLPLPLLDLAPVDLVACGVINEEVFYADAAINYKLDDHQLLGGIYLGRSEITDTSYGANDPSTGSEAITQPLSIIDDGITRRHYALYLHDIYTVSDKWMLNVGARYDHYSDTDSNVAPKVALLYSHNESESYKLMYQRSFRAPTFMELTGKQAPLIGNASLEMETIDTVEFAYNHVTVFDNRFSVNLYYSEMQDFIESDGSLQYVNGEDIRSYGAELEWFYPLSETASLQSNYSYIRAKEKDGDDLPFFANHLANVLLSKTWHRNWHSGTTLRYVGEREREAADPRADLDSYTRFDQAVTYTYKTLTLQATVKNLFDEDIRCPSKLGTLPATGTYVNDFPRDGRTFWFSVEWKLP
ncbi:MAG: TonB-dependent receptor [Campylobacterota bacterium]|nr:TonB-dependent receptor [Campylobacterota bacterium]